MDLDPGQMRRSYDRSVLRPEDLAAGPFEQFGSWLAEAVSAGVLEPNAMTVATADADGRPSARTVLLKAFDDQGFVFYTNLLSRKGLDLAANPRASLVFAWLAMERQVIVVGDVLPVERAEVAAYFASRPHASRIGAWSSEQSSVVASRDVLDERFAALSVRWPDAVPVPEHWGGFRVVPRSVEFWQGRTSRLHDRLRFSRDELSSPWRLERLAP